MIEEPERHIEAFAEAGADSITFHEEATPHANRTLAAIRELGCLAGIAINPGTPVEALAELRGLADIALCMTVNPGWGGQSFIEGSPDKVSRLARRRRRGARSRSTAASTPPPPARSPRPAPRSSSPARPSSAPTTRPRPTPRSPQPPARSRRALSPSRSSAPITSCHQARSAGSSPPRSARRSHQRASAWRPPIATTPLGDHRVAAVGEGDQGAGAVAAAAQDRDDRRCRRPRSGAEGSSTVVAHRPHREDLRRAARRQPRRRLARRSAPRASAWSAPRPPRAARRGRGCAARRPRAARSSRAAGSRAPSRTITLTSASRGRPSSRTRWPAAAAPGRSR